MTTSAPHPRHCDEVSLYTNYQEVKLQERIQCRQALGATPKSLTVLLQDELAGAAQVGGELSVPWSSWTASLAN